MIKQCTKCKEYKDTQHFSWKNKLAKKLASECKECHKIMRKNYYEKNSTKERKRIYERKKQIREWLRQYKKTLKCELCPENTLCCLEFHHKNPSKKEAEVSNMASEGFSKTKIVQEIKKCRVLCSNCHKKVHMGII